MNPKFSIILLVLYVAANVENVLSDGPKHNKVVACSLQSWSRYREEPGKFQIPDIDPSLCTHIIYNYVGLNTSSDSIRSLDKWGDFATDGGFDGFNQITEFRRKHPHLLILVSIGGYNEGSINYSNLVADETKRNRFVENAVDFVRTYKFDGLDIHWEFPGQRGGSPKDRQNLALLVKELKEAFTEYELMVTATFGANRYYHLDAGVDIREHSKYLDLMFIMAYNYHGDWDNKLGVNAPLQSRDGLDVESSIDYILSEGMNPDKLVLGVPFYGRTFLLPETFSGTPKFGLATQQKGFKGPFSNDPGFIGYNEICLQLKDKTSRWKKHWDSASSTPYMWTKQKFISYDNVKSINNKVELAMDNNLAGIMVWSVDLDDSRNICGDGKYPLLKAVNNALLFY